MFLAVDIGNTNIRFALFEGNRLKNRFSIPSSPGQVKLPFGRMHAVHAAFVCSVVPRLTPGISKLVHSHTGTKPFVVGRDIIVPIENRYRVPGQVGQDRLVNAYAGCRLYGSPLIIIDFGTAVTFDVVTRSGAYLGGMILPGLRVSLEALKERTALLPAVSLTAPPELIGRTTSASMLSGIVHGASALTESLTGKIKKKIGARALVIATGGDAALVARFCRSIKRVDADLTLKGLYLLYREAVSGKRADASICA